MRKTLLTGVTLMLATAVLAACGGDNGPAVSDARIGQPTGPNAAMYFTATGTEADRLVGASTAVASSVQIHESTMNDDGSMGMDAVDGLDLPAGGELVLEPGGYHLMLLDVEPLELGDEVDVTLTWEKTGDMVVKAEVVDPAMTMGE
jgi:periplasmic copper chaperone A